MMSCEESMHVQLAVRGYCWVFWSTQNSLLGIRARVSLAIGHAEAESRFQ